MQRTACHDVIKSNLGSILPRFRDILQLFCSKQHPIPIPPEFFFFLGGGAFPLNSVVDVGNPWSEGPKLIMCNYFRSNPTYTPTAPQRHRLTDGRLTIGILSRAHSVSRGKIDHSVAR